MDLFADIITEPINIINTDGEVNYHGQIISENIADNHLQKLLKDIEWRNDEAIILGKRIKTQRKVAWYAEQAFKYTYSKTTKYALPWTPQLLDLKAIVEHKTGETFNACLLNLYHSGNEGMAWHSDAEKDLKKNGAIASLSFGAERKFAFKHKTSKQSVALNLQHGSLLLMKGETQSHWLHRLPPTKTVHGLRVNLTFRTICGQ